MPQTRSYRAPYRPASTGTEPDDMKVDSPGRDMNAKDVIAFAESAIEDDDDDDVAVQGMTQDEDDEEPPYKRICRGKESRLSQALTETGNMSFANPVLVRVGPITSFEDFYIHEARLTQRSPYFEAAFEKLREDGESEVLELPDDDPLVFQLYARYIYNPLSISELELAQDTRNGIYDTYIELLNAYIFGEKVQDSGFQNEIMNQILVCMGDMHKPPTVSRPASSSKRIVKPLIELLYPALPPDSIGRGLAVETFIVLWSHSDELQNFVPHLSRELLTEIAEMLLSGDKDHIRDAWAQAINGDYSYYHSTRSDEH